MQPIDSARWSVRSFGVYFLLLGFALILSPALVLQVLAQPPALEPAWLRMAGLLVAVQGIYYLVLSAGEVLLFWRVSAQVRIGQYPLVALLVLLGWLPTVLLLVQLLELASGLWTWRALSRIREE